MEININACLYMLPEPANGVFVLYYVCLPPFIEIERANIDFTAMTSVCLLEVQCSYFFIVLHKFVILHIYIQ